MNIISGKNAIALRAARLRRFAVWAFWLTLTLNNCFGQQTLTTEDELNEFIDFSRLPLYRSGTSVGQVSTYDREGKNDDGFSGKYSFIRRNADSSLVMFEAKGPGVINRIWTPTPTEDTLDFYVDDSVFSIKYSDLFSGKVNPFTAPLCGNALGGFYCYYPVLFQDSCRIISRGKKLQFHQVQWRKYADGTIVKKSFRKFEFNGGKLSSEKKPAGKNQERTIKIREQSSVVLFVSNAGGRINSFSISPASAFAGFEKNIWIRISYDNEKEPAVYCPAADFFGFAFGKPSMKSWLLGADKDVAYCNLSMPFDKKCRIELVNKSNRPIAFQFSVSTSTKKRNPSTEGKLFSSYNHYRYNQSDGPHTLLNTEGNGHLIGTILQCQGTVPGMTLFFEGDDSTVIDGRLTLHGTGSEDYFNGGWYAFPDQWDDALSLPFHGSLDYNLAYCRTGAYRFYLSDKLPFEKSIHHSIEHGPVNNNIPAIYTSLSFYYGSKPPELLNVPADPSVYLPDTLHVYPQLNDINIWNGVSIKSLWVHDTGGMSYVYTVSDATSLRYSMDNIEDGKYELFMDYDKLSSGAAVRVLQRQSVIKDYFDTYDRDSSRIKMEKIGEIEKNEFLNTVSIEFKTQEKRNEFFLNRLVLVRKK